MDISENSCYLSMVRPPIKSVRHCFSGSCEVERVSFDNDHEALGIVIVI